MMAAKTDRFGALSAAAGTTVAAVGLLNSSSSGRSPGEIARSSWETIPCLPGM